MDKGKKASLRDSLNLLLDLINSINRNDIEYAKIRIKEYQYIANPKFIMELFNYLEKY